MAEVFANISNQVKAGSISVENALEQMKSINFNLFSIEEIQLVEDAEWIPDQEAVDIMKSWMRLHDQVLLELRAFLVLTPEVSKDLLVQFVKATKMPSAPPSLVINNVFEALATAGGTRDFHNPVKHGLISVTSDPAAPNPESYENIFSKDMTVFYNSTPVQNASIVFALPPFLRIQLESYQIGTPKQSGAKKGGLQGWVIEVSNNPTQFTTQVAQVAGDEQLNGSEKLVTYKVDNPTAGFFRYIKLTNAAQNHLGNLSLILKNFDISGKLIIAKE